MIAQFVLSQPNVDVSLQFGRLAMAHLLKQALSSSVALVVERSPQTRPEDFLESTAQSPRSTQQLMQMLATMACRRVSGSNSDITSTSRIVSRYLGCLYPFALPKTLTHLQAFNNTTNLYRVTEAPNLEPRIRPGGVVGSPNVKAGLHTPRSTTDQKSIYVGNLPESTTEAQLKEIFDVYGEIKGCNVIRKPISGMHPGRIMNVPG